MYGWTGTVLRVNLTKGTVLKEPLKQKDAKEYIGGRGLGTKYFIDEVDPNVDSLSPENKLIYANGPLTGTMSVSAGRHDIISKGPLNDTIASSNSGGYFGPELKYAGYDMIIIEGKSEKPVYIFIYNENVEIRDAGSLWGIDAHKTTEMLLEETDPDAKISCIGPAGENLSRIAAIINDKHRAAGRTGIGAVMGSKNLKAVVVRGTNGVKIADKAAFIKTLQVARQKIKDNPVSSGGLPAFGTNVLVNIINEVGGFPTRNWQEAYFKEADMISGETQAKDNLTGTKGCAGCAIGCGRVERAHGKYESSGEGPEYETTWAFGADCGVTDVNAVIKANFLCNELGLDTISMGSTIACAMELYEKGIIDRETTGYDLRFGNGEAMVKLVEDAAYRRGFGNDIADGSYRLAEKYGHPELSMTAKKQEMPAYDPRAIQGIGLEYATSNRGGCHVRGYTISPEVLGLPVSMDPKVTEGKPEILKIFQDLTAALSSSGTCLFTSFAIDANDIAAELESVTGVKYTGEDIMKIGERIYNLERLFIMKNGYTKADDTLPPRLLNDPIPAGPAKGMVSHLPEMLPLYYEGRGWDENGVPTNEKLEELGLLDYAL
ncbi:aldehyde ferredoxin oxidoreductase family protein [Methanoplanus sp. FWC-SCC4]|uniref:Aldehyde ferredoxin oxidoreductase family protein n=1 Tax=Methanochimaera problematica TaxID=2609417 RepID=A0AA97FBM2_9EURY|nr:aldehyde ferredoxin oxidoreductase family protein [Methanoplanus sp. FWC-SCC4]WOF16430.1 aldehyde ferredoxin oxidoreductase family protein [Methanoplanus sp. FWC-SCC4]